MEEKELIARSKKGDEKAFEELIKNVRPKIFYHSLSIVKDEQAAEDIVQDALLHAYQHLSEFQERSKFSTWLWRITHNLSLNYLKKQRNRESPLDENRVVAKKETTEEEEPWMGSLKEALSALPEKHRTVFELYDLKHIPQKQIAAMLKIPLGTVRSRLHYARKKIRAHLKRGDFVK